MKFKFLFLLIIISSIFLFKIYSLESLIFPSNESGIFNNNIELSFKKTPNIDLYYYFEESQDKTPVKYSYPLSLSAMSGESRLYNLVVLAQEEDATIETNRYKYTIDKDIPSQPILNMYDGIYDNELILNFYESNDSIFYCLQSDTNSEFKQWHGETITIPQLDGLNTDFIKSFSQDSAGNRTLVSVNSFTILPLKKIITSLDLVSPVDGIFLNSQLLYMDTKGYKWIRYTFNEADPAIRGTSYVSPVLLKTIGDYNLKIAALPIGSENIIRKEVKFSIISNKNIILNNESGVYTEALDLKFIDGLYYYNLDDKKVVQSNLLTPKFLSIMPVPGVIKYRTIRIGDLSGPGEYRYLFVLDKKMPAAPIISISSNLPVASSTKVRILSTSGANIYYTTDGSTPDRYSKFYKKSFNIDIPHNLNSGSMIIKSIVYFSDKSSSLITSKLLPFDIKKPEKPFLSILSQNKLQTEFNISNIAANRIIYNVNYDGTIPVPPDKNSFTGSAHMTLAVPQGIKEKVIISVALIDRAGNISESVIFNLMESDTVPPIEPHISYIDEKITISGHNDIFYKIVGNNQNNSTDFLVYTNPFFIDLDDNNINDYIIYSYSVDVNGNKSKVNKYSEIKQDNRIPVFPNYTGVLNGGIYNKPISLKFHSSDNIQIYYTISQGSVTPPEPVPSSTNKVNDFLYFDCPVNESRIYTINMLAAYGEDKMVSSPELITFQIDRIAPRAPVISSIISGKVYNEDLNISITDSDTDETLWILIKEKIVEQDLNFTNFEMNGILLNSDYMLKQADNTEKIYQISALSIDTAGNTSISRDIIEFTIDKISPQEPVLSEEYSINNELSIRLISNEDDLIYYEISKNGSYPNDPDVNSNLYILPIEIVDGNGTPVYINAKTMDSAGNFSKSSTLHKIKFIENKIQIPIISVSKISSTINSLSFASITGNKIFVKQGDAEFKEYINPLQIDLRKNDYLDIFYYSKNNMDIKSAVAVYRLDKTSSSGNIISGITNNTIYNSARVVWKLNQSRTVRYEVAIDNDEPQDVTIFSPELTEPIVFDSAEGETLNVSINVKEFTNNIPLLEKIDTNYQFIIDKTKPSVPIVQGVNLDGYYQDNRVIKLISDDKIYYKISTNSNDFNTLDFTRYRNSISLNTTEGKYVNYKVEFYSQDDAGNRSSVKMMDFVIDKANVYVSVNGKDSNTGTRIKPFKTLERALDYINHSERKTINLSEGVFNIDDTLVLNKDISIIGGYILNRWSEGRGETTLNISKRFSALSSMINITSGNIYLERISITNDNNNGSLIQMDGGELVLNDIYLNHTSKNTSVYLNISNSNLQIINSKMVYGSLNSGVILEAENSNILINGTVFEGLGVSRNLKIFNLKKTSFKLSNSVILPATAQKIEIISALNSDINIDKTNFDTGFGTINSSIFQITNSKFEITNTKIGSVASSRILSCFDIKDSTIYIDNSNFNLMADAGISFLRIDNSSLELSNSTILANKTDEFIYLINSKTSIINFDRNTIAINSTDILNGFNMTNSVSVFSSNQISFEGGTTVFTAFNFISPLSIDFISNKIFSNNISWISSEDQASFQISGGKDSVIFKGNNIFGWKSILNINGRDIKTTGELNNYRGFLDIPSGNYSISE